MTPNETSVFSMTSPRPMPAITVEHIYISPAHNFFGRHGRPAGAHPAIEVDSVECIAGRGLRGDRFSSGQRADHKGQLTLFSAEIFQELCRAFDLGDASPAALRRNVIVRGADLNALAGVEFELQGVRLAGVEECRPCYWMDRAIAPGAEAWLRGRGGLRCRILNSGRIRRDATAPKLHIPTFKLR